MMIRTDGAKHQGLRNQLVTGLKKKGIQDDKVLQAIQAIPRHFFLDSGLESFAYEDRAFPIGDGQTISQPYTVAYQTELLQVKMFDKVLEIGTGSAYQASVLAHLGAKVYTIERQKGLFDFRAKHFPFSGKYPTIKFFYGDGFEGLPKHQPFHKILITAAAPFLPPRLVEQLQIGGLLVIPENEGKSQRMKRYTKLENGMLQEEQFELFEFVPMLEGKQKQA